MISVCVSIHLNAIDGWVITPVFRSRPFDCCVTCMEKAELCEHLKLIKVLSGFFQWASRHVWKQLALHLIDCHRKAVPASHNSEKNEEFNFTEALKIFSCSSVYHYQYLLLLGMNLGFLTFCNRCCMFLALIRFHVLLWSMMLQDFGALDVLLFMEACSVLCVLDVTQQFSSTALHFFSHLPCTALLD